MRRAVLVLLATALAFFAIPGHGDPPVSVVCSRFVAWEVRCEARGVFPDRPEWWVYRGDFLDDPSTARDGDRIFVGVDAEWTSIRMLGRGVEICLLARWLEGHGPRFQNDTPCPAWAGLEVTDRDQ